MKAKELVNIDFSKYEKVTIEGVQLSNMKIENGGLSEGMFFIKAYNDKGDLLMITGYEEDEIVRVTEGKNNLFIRKEPSWN